MKVKVLRWIFITITVITLRAVVSSCGSDDKFTIQGSVAGGGNKVLYLEYLGLSGTELIDSVLLDANGRFKFEHPVPEYPDFYRLRLDKQIIPFSISQKVDLQVIADAQSFATSYSIEGELEATQIRDVWLAQLDANVALSKLEKSYEDSAITLDFFVAQRDSIINTYKEVARKYIYNDPASAVAYFALFQQVGGNVVFNLYDKEDSRAYAAVANVYHSYYPEYSRTKHLYDLALRSVIVVREQERRARQSEAIAEQGADELVDVIREVSYIDIELPALNGELVKLSDFANHRLTLLSLTTMTASWAPSFNAQIAKVYERYHPKGLEIFQVGLDSDPHIWKSSVQDLPWINVQDRDGVFSKIVGMYNVNALPALFLISQNGETIDKVDTLDQLIQLIEAKI